MRCTPLRRAPSPAIAEPREHAYRPPSNLNLGAPKRKSPVTVIGTTERFAVCGYVRMLGVSPPDW